MDILTKVEIYSVFTNIESILKANKKIFDLMHERREKFGIVVHQLGDIFAENVLYFLPFYLFISLYKFNFENNINKINK